MPNDDREWKGWVNTKINALEIKVNDINEWRGSVRKNFWKVIVIVVGGVVTVGSTVTATIILAWLGVI